MAAKLIHNLRVKNGKWVYYASKSFDPQDAVFIDNVFKNGKIRVLTDERDEEGRFFRMSGTISS